MRPDLLNSPEVLKEKFRNLKTLIDVADILEIDCKTLIYLVYRKNKPTNYKEFVIKKKSGGERRILAPTSTLKILQRKLNYILSICYEPRPSVQGFVNNRNIVSNASAHSGKKIVFNLDLKDFFPSINFGRVRGLFLKPPFSLPAPVATALANLCCHNNQLPQGAPTSPIISNLICSRMDGAFQALVKKYNAVYTRYADDITISTRQAFFHKEIVESGSAPLCGKGILSIIASNGFIINDAKTRILRTGRRQEVTGLVTNRTPNIKREYIREIRVLLDKWRKYDLRVAEEAYFKNRLKERAPHIKSVEFSKIIEGKINFVKDG
ncbi:MAG: RNA-directed DNA polymerase [Parcubacteria group bacterium]|nr:RNA-directed DNA polymerase [Parcubacteria group bacterium]